LVAVIRKVGKLAAAILLASWLCASVSDASAASLQPIGSFDEPIYVTSDPGNAERLFVVERAGRVIERDGSSSAVFADLRGAIGCAPGGCVGERGLLSIALPEDFDSSGRLFADYAAESDGAIHVVELQAEGGEATLVRNLLTIPHPNHANHYAGQLQFGPEGDLFISTGDGGGPDDVEENAQDTESLLGKILRIDPDPSGVFAYTSPPGNPFIGGPGRDEIWSYGLRNPFRFSFDRTGTALAIGDVGQESREEVDYVPAPGFGGGANYGWNCREGFLGGTVPPEQGCATAGSFTEPIFDYPHENPGDGSAYGCAIIGGYVVRDASLSALYGRYLYGDLCTGEVRSFALADPAGSDRSEGIEVTNLNSFGEDSCGRLYAVSGNGVVSRFIGASAADCSKPTGPLAYSFTGIRAKSRAVRKNKRALISVWVAPCRNRQGQPISLYRGLRRIGTRHLDRVCTARFRPRISRRGKFRATIRSDGKYVEATSRKLAIRPRRKQRRHRR
jgi:hypothetical protein